MNKHSLSSHHRETRASCRVFNFDLIKEPLSARVVPKSLAKLPKLFSKKKELKKLPEKPKEKLFIKYLSPSTFYSAGISLSNISSTTALKSLTDKTHRSSISSLGNLTIEKSLFSPKNPSQSKNLSLQVSQLKAKISDPSDSLSKTGTTTAIKESSIKQKSDTNSSYESSDLENDILEREKLKKFDTENSISQKKFNSSIIRKQTSKKSTVGSLISDHSFLNLQSIKRSSFKRELTLEIILDELNNTPNISVYNELKFKLITKDPLLNGINGSIFK